MIKSEFDPYLNMIYVILDKNGNGFCLEKGRYLKRRKLSDAVNDVEDLANKSEEVSSEAIVSDQIDKLPTLNTLDNQLDFIISKMELATIPYKDN